MSISSEITALGTNLQNAKSAVTAKGGTVGDTGLAGLASEIATIPSGGGGNKPTSWAALKAMSATQLSQIFPVGSVIDSIECKITDSYSGNSFDWYWQVADYGTCKLEGDETEYPCVTLLPVFAGPTVPFDAAEQVLCDSSTEIQAEDGVCYYGTTSASGNPTASNTTALELAAGASIPYADYARIFKTSINTTAANFCSMYVSGYNNYYYSNVRQFLNKSGDAGEWFVPSHVGDVRASQYSSRKGFLSGVPADFLAAIAESEVKVTGMSEAGSSATFTMYDKFFLPSYYEVQLATSPVEGEMWDFVTTPVANPARRCRAWLNSAVGGNCHQWWVRTSSGNSFSTAQQVNYDGGNLGTAAKNSAGIVPACKIILAGA